MKLIKNSVIYLSTEILNKAIPFLILPVLTKYLTPVEYGLFGIYQVILSFITPLVSVSLDIHITRNFFKASKEELSQIISAILILLNIHLLIATVLVYIISILFQNPFGLSNDVLYIMPLIIYLQTINQFNLTIVRNEEKALKFGIIKISQTAINFSLIFIFLFLFNYGWKSLIYAILVSNFVIALYSFTDIKNNFNINYKISYSVAKIYKISLPLIFHLLGGALIFFSDRVMIQQLIGLKEVGIYTISNQFGSIAMIVINSIILAISPWMYKKLANNVNIQKEIYWMMLGFLVVGVFIYFIDIILFKFMTDKQYHTNSVNTIIFWLVLAFVIRGWYQLYYNIILDKGKTNVFMYITLSAGILNIILNYFLIKKIGVVGAAISTFLSFLFMFIFLIFYTNVKKEVLNEKVDFIRFKKFL